ncbi:RloB family protein [Butyrivibrio sp. VCB2001]|uniref:RloB family protein n=1 Tax=Butyrivibrio sp. VCB2001 TaxID=1280667 RepID=UPI00041F52AA|nr:RloB family protein [Butyrivibrio sp. VCB2001]
MAKRDISLKRRGTKSKKERVTYLVIAEGRNKTETLYLSNFQEQGKEYYIRFVKAGSKTDAEALYKTLLAKWRELGLSASSGDKGFIVLDIDNDKKKADKVMALINKNVNGAISFIVSNPVFEIWLLLHFKYTTKFYENGNQVVKDLKKYIENYEKNLDCYEICKDKLDNAVLNAEKLVANYEGMVWPSIECNPRTDMVDFIKCLTI